MSPRLIRILRIPPSSSAIQIPAPVGLAIDPEGRRISFRVSIVATVLREVGRATDVPWISRLALCNKTAARLNGKQVEFRRIPGQSLRSRPKVLRMDNITACNIQGAPRKVFVDRRRQCDDAIGPVQFFRADNHA